MNDKITWCSKVLNVMTFDLHIMIISCISDLVLHSPLCKNIHCNFIFVSSHNLMCYVVFYLHCLLVQSQQHCSCRIVMFKLTIWTFRFILLIAKLFSCWISHVMSNPSMEIFKVDKVVEGKCGKISNYMVKLDLNALNV